MVDASIGILTWRSRNLLEGCLDSILSNHWKYRYEIIVVDNGSLDGTVEMVKTKYPAVRLIENPMNRGVAPARNQIFKQATGRYTIFLDVDTLVMPGSLDTLVQVMDENPAAAIGGPKLVYRDGRLQLSCRPFPSPLNILIEGTFLRDYFPNSRFVKRYTMEDWDHKDLAPVDWMYGACLIVRMAEMKSLGGFDEGFFYLYEDVDLCFRAKWTGSEVLYIPEAHIIHFLERERRSVLHRVITDHVRSILRYLVKDYYGRAH